MVTGRQAPDDTLNQQVVGSSPTRPTIRNPVTGGVLRVKERCRPKKQSMSGAPLGGASGHNIGRRPSATMNAEPARATLGPAHRARREGVFRDRLANSPGFHSISTPLACVACEERLQPQVGLAQVALR